MSAKKAALISVSDRSGLVPFAQGLQRLGFTILTTSGSGAFLSQHGVESVAIEQYTGQKEILDGRVKTLHPRIYAGILARRDNPKDLAQLEADNILPIEVVAVNLYPFESNLSVSGTASEGKSLLEMIELVDIGGPSMIRAAAKNHRFVFPVIDPTDYEEVLKVLAGDPPSGTDAIETFRRGLAAKVFATLARDNLAAGGYFASSCDPQPGSAFSRLSGMVLKRRAEMRYGENPHQKAVYYQPMTTSMSPSLGGWEQLGGKELSYNNMLDIEAAVRLIGSVQGGVAGCSKPAVIIIKHLNPCGAAFGDSLHDALLKAKRSDPRSHFGGIIGCTDTVTKDVAEAVREDFAEIVVAPKFDDEALAVLRTSKNLRIVRIGIDLLTGGPFGGVEYRSCLGGMLVQEVDRRISSPSDARIVSQRRPTTSEMADLSFAWTICAHVKSNAIVVVKAGTVLGVGAGQMSRIDSVELALSKARFHGHDLLDSVAASDAFFPFPDSIETLAQAGVRAVIAPAGAKRDPESIEAANKLGVAVLFAEDRPFRH